MVRSRFVRETTFMRRLPKRVDSSLDARSQKVTRDGCVVEGTQEVPRFCRRHHSIRGHAETQDAPRELGVAKLVVSHGFEHRSGDGIRLALRKVEKLQRTHCFPKATITQREACERSDRSYRCRAING
jgi:hypothetical protein